MLQVNLIHVKFRFNLIKYINVAGKYSGGSKKEEEKKKDDEPVEKDKESKDDVKSGSAADAAAASAADAFEESLICIICQEILHDCIRYVERFIKCNMECFTWECYEFKERKFYFYF